MLEASKSMPKRYEPRTYEGFRPRCHRYRGLQPLTSGESKASGRVELDVTKVLFGAGSTSGCIEVDSLLDQSRF